MKLGLYDQKIKLITEGITSDGAGGTIPISTVVLDTWARIEQLPVSRDLEQAQLGLVSIYRVNIQARSGIFPSVKHILEWNGERYQIISGPVVESVRYKTEWQFDIKKKDG